MMPLSIDSVLTVAREVEGSNWQIVLDTDVDGDEHTTWMWPVVREGDTEEYGLLVILGDPEEGVLEPQLRVMPIEEFHHFMAQAEEHMA